MALGLTKDSMVDLQSLVQGKNEAVGEKDTLSLLTTGQSEKGISEYQKLAQRDTPNPAEQEPHQSVQLEEATKARESISLAASGEHGNDPSRSPRSSWDAEEEKKQDSYGQYAGFATNYEDYSYDPYVVHYSHRPSTGLTLHKKKSEGGFLCCIFPWLQSSAPDAEIMSQAGESKDDSAVEESVAVEKQSNSNKSPLRKPSSGESDDDVSTASVGSDKLGEKLSEKDRQAVLARLRLATPDLAATDASAASPGSAGKDKVQGKGLLNGIPNLADDSASQCDLSVGSSGTKGILKRQSTVVKNADQKSVGEDSKRRRSLFPVYETTNKTKKHNNNVQFSPMARVMTVRSQKDMTPEDKSSVWWQKWDYEDFRKTGRIITQAMLAGGSEIWLASNQSWQHQGTTKKETLRKAVSMTDQPKAKKKIVRGLGSEKSASNDTDLIMRNSDKWWHKFGHSRRGLEHIASINEGSERQVNVRHAIRSVLDEQRRQKAYLREDPEKLRMVAIHNTAWARDLALASGASDRDAVRNDFKEGRKSREFYLLKMARSNNITSHGKHVPAFMQPAIASSVAQRLDAYTSAQIMDRRKQQRALVQAQQVQAQLAPPEPKKPNKRSSMPPSAGRAVAEPIHDPAPAQDESHKDLAKRAAGFSHPGAEQVNMAAVLSGMGGVPKNATTVGA